MFVRIQSGKIDAVIVRAGVFAGSVTFALGLCGATSALAQSCGELTITGPGGRRHRST
jgi:hypothetical protein